MVVAVGVDRFWRVGLTAPPGVVIIPVFSASEDPCLSTGGLCASFVDLDGFVRRGRLLAGHVRWCL